MPTYNTFDRERQEKRELKRKGGRVELRNVCCVLESLMQAVENNLRGRQQVVIVDDYCTDETEDRLIELLNKKAKRVSDEDKRIKFIAHKLDLELTITVLKHTKGDRIGLNFAVVNGYKEALKAGPEFVIKLDSDGEHDETRFPELLKEIQTDNRTVFVRFGVSDRRDRRAFGFRITRNAALDGIIDHLEKYACDVWERYPNQRDEQRKIDKETEKLIEKKFPNQSTFIPF